jgi:hypothetical protein
MLEPTERRYADGSVWEEPMIHDVYITAQRGFDTSDNGSFQHLTHQPWQTYWQLFVISEELLSLSFAQFPRT